MFTGRAVVSVQVKRDFGDYKGGDIVLMEDWKAIVLWKEGIVEIIDESEKVIAEIERTIKEEREVEPLIPIPPEIYDRINFYKYYLTEYLQKNMKENIETLESKVKKLKNLQEGERRLKEIRLKKILEAVRLRPNSLEILGRLAPEERRIYLELSKLRREWLGEV